MTEVGPPREPGTEAELLRRVGEGDRAAFGQLYDRFSGVLFSVAYRVLNDSNAAEDVLQDVFVQIWEKAPLYDPSRGKPMTWAITMTRNKAIDRLRSAQRRNRLQGEVVEEAKSLAQFEDSGSAEAVEAAETGQIVLEALEQLPTDQRVPIEMAFLKSMTQSEIAEALGEPLGTIKARIRRGLLRLRQIVGPRLD
jgi:RNA polymerase sigma-70 factor (ECF subfamily)